MSGLGQIIVLDWVSWQGKKLQGSISRFSVRSSLRLIIKLWGFCMMKESRLVFGLVILEG